MPHPLLRAHKIGAIMLPLLLAACASGGGSGGRPAGPLAANPSAFVAADLAFSRLTQEKGQIAAFREKAHEEAVLVGVELLSARDALRRQAEPAQRMRWQPHGVYSSCDGNMALTYGAWQAGEKHGRYQTLWMRDARGEIRWRADVRSETATALEAPEYIATKAATCRPRAPKPEGAAASSAGARADYSFKWSIAGAADAPKYLAISLWDGENFIAVMGDGVEKLARD